MLEKGSSGRLWPVHLKPREDELLSSWLVRLATDHRLRVQTFCYAVWPNRNLWKLDTDFTDDQEILEQLAEKTNTSPDRTLSTTLATYEGVLFQKATRNGIYTWILARWGRRGSEQTYGLQFCPWCLSEDEKPYFRRRWRLGFNILCPVHHSLLLDRCLRCGGAIKLHRTISPAERYGASPVEITRCHQCLHDLRNFAVEQYRQEVDSEEIKFQHFLSTALEQGWINLAGTGYIYSHLFFAGLHQIASVVIGNRKSRHIQVALAEHFHLKRFIDVSSRRNRTFRSFGVVERRGLLEACWCLLKNWPDNFVNFCRANSLLSGELVLTDVELPYWYFKVIREHLMCEHYTYVVTEEEFESVIKYLAGKKIEPTFGELCKYLPRNAVYAFMKRENLISKPFIIERCPRCKTTAFQYRAGRGRNGAPKFRCKACNQRHPEDKNRDLHKYAPQIRREAVNLYLERGSFREVSRIMSIKRDTIKRWYKEYTEA